MDIRPASSIRSGSWSIATRMTLFYTLSTFCLLVLATGFLYWALQRNLESEDQETIDSRISVMRAILRDRPDDTNALSGELQLEAQAGVRHKYYGRLLDETERLVAATPGMDSVLPTKDQFPSPVPANLRPARGVYWKTPRERTFLLASAQVVVGSPRRGTRIYQVAMDVSSEAASLRDYQHKIAVILIAGMVLSAGAAIWITRRGIQPLQEITRAAERITATQLSERITPDRWPKELTALATAFDNMLGRLEDSFNRLSRFSADLAHELRTPINNLMGEAEVALSRSRPPDEYRAVLESSLEEFSQLSRMIDNLLFLARAENAEQQLQRSSFDARKAVQTVLEFYEAVADEQSVVMACHGDALLEADPILFRRAISNLVSNALHHTGEGGRIIVSVRPATDGPVEVRVSDTGSGIQAEHLPKIFDRFYRVDPSRAQSPKGQGMGLGLAIVKSIVELHGGQISVESERGKGTSFNLVFPGQPQPAVVEI